MTAMKKPPKKRPPCLLANQGSLQKVAQRRRSMGKANCLRGYNFVMTGTLSMTRSVVQDYINDAGGRVQRGIRANTDFLVVGRSPRGTSSKETKAKAAGVRIINEDTLTRMVIGSLDPEYAWSKKEEKPSFKFTDNRKVKRVSKEEAAAIAKQASAAVTPAFTGVVSTVDELAKLKALIDDG